MPSGLAYGRATAESNRATGDVKLSAALEQELERRIAVLESALTQKDDVIDTLNKTVQFLNTKVRTMLATPSSVATPQQPGDPTDEPPQVSHAIT